MVRWSNPTYLLQGTQRFVLSNGMQLGVESLCQPTQGNFLEMPFEKDVFDGAYAIEATCHADKVDTFWQGFQPTWVALPYVPYISCSKSHIHASFHQLCCQAHPEPSDVSAHLQ